MATKGDNEPESPQDGWAGRWNSFKHFSSIYKPKTFTKEAFLSGNKAPLGTRGSHLGLIYCGIKCNLRETWFGLVSRGSGDPLSGSNSRNEASPSLRSGSDGLALHQRGVWDLVLQHFLRSQTGAAPTLWRRAHPLGLSCLWVSLFLLRISVAVQWMALAH